MAMKYKRPTDALRTSDGGKKEKDLKITTGRPTDALRPQGVKEKAESMLRPNMAQKKATREKQAAPVERIMRGKSQSANAGATVGTGERQSAQAVVSRPATPVSDTLRVAHESAQQEVERVKNQPDIRDWTQEELDRSMELLRMGGTVEEMVARQQELVDNGVRRRKQEIGAAESKRDGLAAAYYDVENQEKKAAMSQDKTASDLYASLQALQKDRKQYQALMGTGSLAREAMQGELSRKYGVGVGGDLLSTMLQKEAEAKATLAELGYDFDRMEEYQRTQEQKAKAEEKQRKTAEFASGGIRITEGALRDMQGFMADPEGYRPVIDDTYLKENEGATKVASGVVSSAASVLASPLQGIDYLQKLGQGVGRSDQNDLDHYVPLHTYDMDATNFVRTVRGTVAQEIEDEVEGTWGKVGSFAYQTGMSMADFLFNAFLTGNFTGGLGGAGTEAAKKAASNLSLAIMGSGAASNTTMEAIERGLNNRQALTLGAVAGMAEVITEKVSLEALLDKTSMGKSLRGYILQNFISEGSEEVGSDIINLVADILISKDKSEWAQSVAAYEAQGLTPGQAVGMAVKDQALSMGLDFLGGALSGGIMAGGSAAINNALTHGDAVQTGADMNAMGSDVVLATIEEGLQSDKATDSYKRARALQRKLERGETITDKELGRLYQANVVAIDEENREAEALPRPGEEQKGPQFLPGTPTPEVAARFGLTQEANRQAFGHLETEAKPGERAVEYLPRPGEESRASRYLPKPGEENFAREYVSEPGLVYDDTLRFSVDTAQFNRLNEVAKALGTRVRFVDSVQGGLANAQIVGNEILVERNNRNPVSFLLGHEWTHRIQSLAPEAYAQFRDSIAAELGSEAARIQQLYESKGLEITPEGALDEAAADYAGRLLEDGKLLDEFIERNRGDKTFLEKVLDAIKSFIGRLTGSEKAQAETAAGKLSAALDAARTANENAALQDGGTQFALKGTRQDGMEVYETSPEILAMPQKQKMSQFLTLMENEYAGRTARFTMDGETLYAKFDRTDLQKNIYGDKRSDRAGWKAKINTGADGGIFDLVENATHKGSGTEVGKATAAHKGVTGWEYFVKTVQIDGQVFDLLANVRKKPEGEYVYSIQLRKSNQEIPAALSANGLPASKQGLPDTDSISQDGGDVNGKFSLKEYTETEKQEHAKTALEHFGRTFSWRETGYLTGDGKKIDFSGRHEGGPGGYRTVDHRDIRDALGMDYGGSDYSGSMVQFMAEGNIRISPESNGINLSVMPSKAQMEALDDFISRARGEVTLDIDTPGGDTVVSVEYPRGTRASKVLSDIQQYFTDGTQPYISEVQKYRYSLKQDGDKKKTTKPIAESKPIIAQRELKNNLMALYSTPSGMRGEMGRLIDTAAQQILKEGALTEENRNRLMNRLYDAGVVEVPADQYYALGLQAVAGQRIYVDEKTKHEFSDDWNSFRQRAWAAGIYLVNDPNENGIDTWYQELHGAMPGIFNANEYDNRGILENIVQVAEEGKAKKVSLAEYTAQVSEMEYTPEEVLLADMEKQFDYQLRAFAEKAGLEIKLRDRTGIKLAQEQEARRQKAQAQREARVLRDLQKHTLKQAQWLTKNQNRLPGDLRGMAQELLDNLDVLALSTANEMRWSEKYGSTWQDLRSAYLAAEQTDPNFIPSAEIKRIVMRLDAKKISELDIGALNDLCKAITGIRTEVTNRNRLINEEMDLLMADLYADMKQQVPAAKGGKTGREGYAATAMDKFFSAHLTPMNALNRMGGWRPDSAMMVMAKQLEQGERAEKAYRTQAEAQLADFLRENEDWVKRADGQGEDAIWYELEVPQLMKLGMGDKPIFGPTVKVYMTPAQKVHLYLESKNIDNLRHIAYGGRTFAIRELYSQGKRSEAFSQSTETIRLAPETVRKIVSDLTPEEQALADLLEQHYNVFAKERINKVSNVLYGYDKTIGAHYAPIFTNSNFNRTEIGVFDLTPEGVGNMKARQGGVNPTYNISAFDAFERSVQKTAQFVGKAIPMRNWSTLMNYQEKGSSFQQLISQKWGKEMGTDYLEALLSEWQGNTTKEKSGPDVMNTLLSNYISAVFGANPSIIIKQFMSYPLAATYLGWDTMANPIAAQKVSDDLINAYTSEYAYRLLGYATPETSQLKNNPSTLADRLGSTKLGRTKAGKAAIDFASGKGITAMDGWTVKAIWSWAENAVRKDSPDLDMGTQEQIDKGQSPFYQEVARRFEEAVSNSQPMYDVMHRADIMRKSGTGWRALTLFKTVPLQQYNMLRQSIEEARYFNQAMKDGTATAEQYAAAKKKAGSAVLGVILAGLGIEVINFLNALLKNKGKRYRDEDGELTAESVLKQYAAGFVSDNAGMVAGGDMLTELLGNVLEGKKWYGLSAPGFEQADEVIEQIISSCGTVQQLTGDAFDVVKNGGDLGEYFARHGADYVGAIKEACMTVATYYGGVAANNIEAYALGAISWMSPEAKTAYEDALETADKSGLAGLTGGALETRVESVLKNRLGSTEGDAAKILSELYEAGYREVIPSNTPSRVTVNGEERTLGAYQQQVYDTEWRKRVSGELEALVTSELFQRAGPMAQARMIKKLYDYAGDYAKQKVSNDYELQKQTLNAERMIQAGGSAADWAAWEGIAAAVETDSDRYALLQTSGFSEELKVAVLGNMMGTTELKTESGGLSQYGKLQKVLETQDVEGYLYLRRQNAVDLYLKSADWGITPEQCVAVREAISQVDDNGSVTQAEAQRALEGLKMSQQEKAALWQLQNKSWKPEKNPFDAETGRKVYNAMNGGKETETGSGRPTDALRTSGQSSGTGRPTDALRSSAGSGSQGTTGRPTDALRNSGQGGMTGRPTDALRMGTGQSAKTGRPTDVLRGK